MTKLLHFIEQQIIERLKQLQRTRPQIFFLIFIVLTIIVLLWLIWQQVFTEVKRNEILDRLDPWKQEQPVFRSTTYIVNPKNSFLIENINNTGDDSKDLHIAFDELSRIATKHGKIINTDTGTFWSVLLWGSPNFDTTDLQDQTKHDLYAGYEVGNMSPSFEVKFSYYPPWVNANLQTSSIKNSDSISIKIEGKVTSLQQDLANTIKIKISFNYRDTTITSYLTTELKHQEQLGYNYRSFTYNGTFAPSIRNESDLLSISFAAADAAQNIFTKKIGSEEIHRREIIEIGHTNLDSIFMLQSLDSKNQKNYPKLNLRSSQKGYIPFSKRNQLPPNTLTDIADIKYTAIKKNSYNISITFKNWKKLFGYTSMSIALVKTPFTPPNDPIYGLQDLGGFTQNGLTYQTNFTFEIPKIDIDTYISNQFALIIRVDITSEDAPYSARYYYSIPIEPEILDH